MEKPSTPGTLLLGGIVLIDEPAQAGVTVFGGEGDGSALLTIITRAGGEIGQVIIGLTPNQAVQLIERLSAHADVFHRAILQGKGGAGFQNIERRRKT